MTQKAKKTRQRWGVKRPDGTIIQSRPEKTKVWAIASSRHEDEGLARAFPFDYDSWGSLVKRAARAGYAIVPVEVVEVKP